MPSAVQQDPGPPRMRRSLGVKDGVAIAASSTAATTSIGIGMGALAASSAGSARAVLLAFLPILGIARRLRPAEPSRAELRQRLRLGGPVPRPLARIPDRLGELVATVIFLAYTSGGDRLGRAPARQQGGPVQRVAGSAGSGLDRLRPRPWACWSWSSSRSPPSPGVRTAPGSRSGCWSSSTPSCWSSAATALVTGDHAFSLSWLNPFEIPSATGVAQGMLLAVFFYWGWDAAFSVNEETRDPRDAARGGPIALVTMLGLFLLGSLAFQRVMTADELPDTAPQGLTFLGEPLADRTLGRAAPGRADVLRRRLAAGQRDPDRPRHVRDEPATVRWARCGPGSARATAPRRWAPC